MWPQEARAGQASSWPQQPWTEAWHHQGRLPRRPEGQIMAGQGWWRLPAAGLAPGRTGWGLLGKRLIVPVLSLWAGPVPLQLLISSAPRSGAGCQALSSCCCSWDLVPHPESGAGAFPELNGQQPHGPRVGDWEWREALEPGTQSQLWNSGLYPCSGAVWVLCTRGRGCLAPQVPSWWVGSRRTSWHRLNV